MNRSFPTISTFIACLVVTTSAMADPVSFLGFTQNQPLGHLGVFHYSGLCRTAFSRDDARMCRAPEVINASTVPTGLTGEAWVLPDASLEGYVSPTLGSQLQETCIGWTQTIEMGVAVDGLRVDASGVFFDAACNTSARIACCAPDAPPTGMVYEMVGHTQASVAGDVGMLGMHTACAAEFDDTTRMCSVDEAWATPVAPSGLTDPAWIRKSPSLRDVPFRAPDESFREIRDCGGWSVTAGSGAAVTPTGGIVHESCNEARPVSCCRPVPEPSAMNGLVPGVAILLALPKVRGRCRS